MRTFANPYQKGCGKALIFLSCAEGLASEPYHAYFCQPLPKTLGKGVNFSKLGRGASIRALSRVLSSAPAEKVGGRR